MKTLLKKKTTISEKDNLIILCNSNTDLSLKFLSKPELEFIKQEQKKHKEIVEINQYRRLIFIVTPKKELDNNKYAENCRLLGDSLTEKLKTKESVLILDEKKNQKEVLLIAEGMALSNYTFTKHKTDPKPNNLKFIFLCNESNPKQIAEIQNVINAVYTTRDLINEPFSHLTAKNFSR